MIIDTHCHYNLSPLADDWSVHWQAAQAVGVQRSIVVGTNPQTSQQAVTIASTDPHLFASLGVHPSEYQEDLTRNIAADMAALETLVQQPRVVAVGETGLDYFRLPTEPKESERVKTLQKAAFAAHVDFAKNHQLPLIIHVRDTMESITQPNNAYYDVLQVLRMYHDGKTPVILHCVSGPLDYISQAVSMGAYIGVAANCTYKKSDAIREIVRAVPADRLLSETDAPFLPPQEYRGQTCEPWMISKTVEYLERELDIRPQQLIENATRLFPQLMLQ